MDPAKDGGSFSGGARPLDGLGNYKGVMLCNRPPDDLSRSHGVQGGQPPFKSTIAPTAGEQLGLQPPKQLEPKTEVKTRGPSAALRRHCQWIKELQQQVQEDRKEAEHGAQTQEQRKFKMQEVFKQQREAIRQIKSERGGNIEPGALEAIIRPTTKQQVPVACRKPLWAMTEEERDGCEDEEAEDLIRFAEDLDYNTFIDDLEFRQCLQVVKDRAKRLQREQDAFKDSLVREFSASADAEDDCSSTGVGFSAGGEKHGSLRRRFSDALEDKPDWDKSTSCGDDAYAVDKGLKTAAQHALEANPQLRGVHSKGSVQRIIERAQGSPC